MDSVDSMEDPEFAQPLKPGIKVRIIGFSVREFPFVIVLVVFAICNLVLPTVFWPSGNNRWSMIPNMCFGGIFASEVPILTMISVLRNSDWQVPLIGSVLGLGGLATTFVLGLKLADPTLPIFEAVWFYCIAVASYVAVVVSSFFIQAWTGLRMEIGLGNQTNSQKKQYSVGFLLVVMTVVAVIISVVRAVLPTKNPGGGPAIGELMLLSALFMIYSFMLFVPSIAIGITKGRKTLWIGIVVFTMVVIGTVVMQSVAQITRSPFSMESYVYFYSYSFGFVSSVIAVFGWFRYQGYRMIRKN